MAIPITSSDEISRLYEQLANHISAENEQEVRRAYKELLRSGEPMGKIVGLAMSSVREMENRRECRGSESATNELAEVQRVPLEPRQSASEVSSQQRPSVDVLEFSPDAVVTEEPADRKIITQRFWKTLRRTALGVGSMLLVLSLTASPIAESSLISQEAGSVLPVIATLHRSSFANQMGHQHATGVAVNAVPSKSGPPGSASIALIAAVSASMAHVVAEPVNPTAGPRASVGALVLAEIASIPAMSPGPPPAPESSGLSPDRTLSASDVSALLARGDDQLRLGDFTSARLFYEAAADAGDANAALRLGETFDPIFIDRVNLRGARADMERAVFWYRRARDLGSGAAGDLLKELDEITQKPNG